MRFNALFLLVIDRPELKIVLEILEGSLDRDQLQIILPDQLRLSEFWSSRLPPSREGTRWLNVLMTLVIYRLIDPGSEWRLHRQSQTHSDVANGEGKMSAA
jgi:hypothetical protein